MDNRNDFYYYILITIGHLRYITCWFDTHLQSKMITTLKLINIFISSHSHHLCVLVRAPEIYSLSQFPVSITTLLMITIMLCIRSLDLFILSNYNSILQPASLHFLTSLLLATTLLLPASIYFTFLNSTYKWDKFFFFFLSLLFLKLIDKNYVFPHGMWNVFKL